MRIKKPENITYGIKFKRGGDEQSIVISDATEEEVHNIIINTFRDRFVSYNRSKVIPTTVVTFTERDSEKHRIRPCNFSFQVRNNKVIETPYARVANLSPRQTRIALENAIKRI